MAKKGDREGEEGGKIKQKERKKPGRERRRRKGKWSRR